MIGLESTKDISQEYYETALSVGQVHSDTPARCNNAVRSILSPEREIKLWVLKHQQ